MRARKLIAANGGSTSIAGKTLGFIPTAYTGYNVYEDYEPEPSYYYHDWSVYAAANSAIAGVPDLTVVTTRVIEVPGGRGPVFGSRPPEENQFNIIGKYIVFDATSIPIGTTFY